jgi:Integrase core domain
MCRGNWYSGGVHGVGPGLRQQGGDVQPALLPGAIAESGDRSDGGTERWTVPPVGPTDRQTEATKARKGETYDHDTSRDNAVAETFFATLKKELVNRHSWPSRRELQSAVFEYIEAFYNRQRRHSMLGMVSPAEYEQTQTTVTSIKIKQPTT